MVVWYASNFNEKIYERLTKIIKTRAVRVKFIKVMSDDQIVGKNLGYVYAKNTRCHSCPTILAIFNIFRTKIPHFIIVRNLPHNFFGWPQQKKKQFEY